MQNNNNLNPNFQNNTADSYNYSLAFLRAFLSFVVVTVHYWFPVTEEYAGNYPAQMLFRFQAAATSIFIIMSFVLTINTFKNFKMDKLKKRLWRLIYPLFAWAVIYYIWYGSIMSLTLKGILHTKFSVNLSFINLLRQALLGCDQDLAPQLWYQFVLIALSIIFFIVFSKPFKKYADKILLLLAVVSIAMQYLGLNYRLFQNHFYLQRSFGRIAEFMPLACLGYFLGSRALLDKIKSNRIYVIIISLLSLYLVVNSNIFSYPDYNFSCGGTYLLAYALFFFLLIYAIPFEKLPGFIKAILKFLARYSFGIYCIHMGVGYCFNRILCFNYSWAPYPESIIQSVWIYLISLLLCYLISKIPSKFAKQLVE